MKKRLTSKTVAYAPGGRTPPSLSGPNLGKAQTKMIDSLMEGWKQQLKSSTPMAIPHRFTTGLSAGGMPEFNPLTPWTFWMQAAEIWQRTWVPDMAHKDRSH